MNTNSIFYLDPSNTKIVHGAKASAIYDFSSGEVVPVSPAFSSHLNGDSHTLSIPPNPPKELPLLVKSLLNRNMGRFTAYTSGRIVTEMTIESKRDFAWLELTEQCNLKCLHCYGTCGPDPSNKQSLSYEDWFRIINEVRQCGFDRIQFIGGEPLLSPYLLDLIYEADRLQFSFIEIFSNLLLLDDEFLNCVKACNGRLATTLYSTDPNVHDSITGTTGSFHVTTQSIKRATQRKIPLRASCIVTQMNEGKVGDLKELCDTLGAHFGGEDLARPTGRGSESSCRSTIPRHNISQPFHTNLEAFREAQIYNSCWKGKITVTDQGDVLPCVFAREQSGGNLREDTLKNILEKPQGLMNFWSLTKDHIETCKDCEFRYACTDCRPLASGWANGDLMAKTYGCPYDPYTATWR